MLCVLGRAWELGRGAFLLFGVLDVGLGGAVCPSGRARGVAGFVGMWEGAGWDRGYSLSLGCRCARAVEWCWELTRCVDYRRGVRSL